jgi:hypothetical protein
MVTALEAASSQPNAEALQGQISLKIQKTRDACGTPILCWSPKGAVIEVIDTTVAE